MKKVGFIAAFLWISVWATAQPNVVVDTLIKQVNDLQRLRLKHRASEQREKVALAFATAVARLVHYPQFCGKSIDPTYRYWKNAAEVEDEEGRILVYAFMNNIVYCESEDGQVRLFSWDNLNGGSYHDYTVLIQYPTPENPRGIACKIIPLDTESEAIKVGYYKILQVDLPQKRLYCLLGYGTYGGGKHHRSLRIFELLDNEFTEATNYYPDGKQPYLASNRAQEVALSYDPEKQRIQYKSYSFDEDNGFYKREFEWKYIDLTQ